MTSGIIPLKVIRLKSFLISIAATLEKSIIRLSYSEQVDLLHFKDPNKLYEALKEVDRKNRG